jgi:hypothetical protein
MSRMVWFVAGAGAGVYAMVKARRTAEILTPEGLSDRLAGLAVGAQLFGEEVRAGMDEKEGELRRRLGLALAGAGRPELTGGPERAPTPIDRREHPGLEHQGKGND